MSGHKIYQGNLDGKGLRFALVVSRFNDFITKRLQDGAVDALLQSNVRENDIDIIKVPGSFEIPPVVKKVIELKKHNAIICLGAVIQGDTPHFQYVASEVSKGVAQLSLTSNIPIIFGVLTTENVEQAIDRAGAKSGNKGWEASIQAIEMANLFKTLS